MGWLEDNWPVAGGFHAADFDLDLKREVSFWQKTELYTKENLLVTILRRQRKAESLDKINTSTFSATEKAFGFCEEIKTFICLDVFIIF